MEKVPTEVGFGINSPGQSYIISTRWGIAKLTICRDLGPSNH